ncbi:MULTISPECIES: O-antigen ligase family protein [Microbacterium]|uniref:O-antigen ligase family protein n=1 Tax=Microbacterium TaxID=33882 RepID=UPI002785DBED|nr:MULTISPECIES: O-antigen ligase family protein [Microbacterium]MDQ1083277.1 exopolysaccharide production protein ExoQ [Microbacterium sp. SORGH_AS_0344]MDQ1171444.1 exopolysaccharide production protein ExoQ [Microbacterium proteolyticum]
MAMYTKHPVSALPTPPPRETTRHLLLRAWCVFVILLALGGVGLVNAAGPVVAAVVAGASAVVSAVIWIVTRPPLAVRRLPWLAFGYLAWATASLAWSAWPVASVLTWLLLVITTFQGLFVGAVLTWRDVVRAVASAAKWVVGLSLLFEVAVSLLVRGPLLPGFVVPTGRTDPILYWSRDNLFDGGRIQGVLGNADLLAAVSLVAVIVFGVYLAAGAPHRVRLSIWTAAAVFLFIRAGSTTASIAAAFVVLVLGTVLVMRTARRPGERTRWYLLYAAIGLGAAAALWFGREVVFGVLGRGADLLGREGVWADVLRRADQRPLVGWGFSTPWIPTEPLIDGWIVERGQTVVQAHSVWLDAYLQLGAIGVALLVLVYLAYLWRSWFFAVDRPRWDLRDDRPHSALTLLPTLVGALLVVQGLTESGPLLLWGWMFVVLFGAKIKQTPIVGHGPGEESDPPPRAA